MPSALDRRVARRMRRSRRASRSWPSSLALAGCASRTRAPVEDRTSPRRRRRRRRAAPASPPAPPRRASPPRPTRGPDLHRQARRHARTRSRSTHGLDYRELAAWNNIENLNLIRVGQVLRLTRARREPRCRRPASPRRRCARRAAGPSRGATGASASPRRRIAADRAVARSSDGLQVGAEGAARSRTRSRRCATSRWRAARRRREPAATARAALAAPPAVAREAERRRRARRADDAGDDDRHRLGVAGEGQGRRRVLRDRPTSRASTSRAPRGSRCVASAPGTVVYAGTRIARLRQAHHHQAQQDLPVRLRAQPRHPRQGRRAGRRKGQKIAEMGNTDADRGEAALRDPPAWASRWTPRATCRPHEASRGVAARAESPDGAALRTEPDDASDDAAGARPLLGRPAARRAAAGAVRATSSPTSRSSTSTTSASTRC